MIVLMKLPNSSLATLVHIKRHDCQCISRPLPCPRLPSLHPFLSRCLCIYNPKKLIESRIGIPPKKKKGTHPKLPFFWKEQALSMSPIFSFISDNRINHGMQSLSRFSFYWFNISSSTAIGYGAITFLVWSSHLFN